MTQPEAAAARSWYTTIVHGKSLPRAISDCTAFMLTRCDTFTENGKLPRRRFITRGKEKTYDLVVIPHVDQYQFDIRQPNESFVDTTPLYQVRVERQHTSDAPRIAVADWDQEQQHWVWRQKESPGSTPYFMNSKEIITAVQNFEDIFLSLANVVCKK